MCVCIYASRFLRVRGVQEIGSPSSLAVIAQFSLRLSFPKDALVPPFGGPSLQKLTTSPDDLAGLRHVVAVNVPTFNYLV